MKKVLSFVLCFVMVFSLLPMASFAIVNPPAYDKDDLHMTKTLTKKDDGTYRIDIEAWTTGEVDITTITKSVPTDFILVIDESGSMTDAMQEVQQYTGSVSWSQIYNNNIYLWKDDDGNLYRLQATRGSLVFGRYVIRYSNGTDYVTLAEGSSISQPSISGSSGRLYRYVNGSTSRLTALRNAANSFVNLVKEKSDAENGEVYGDHRVAIVGFSSNPGTYNTNEILTGTRGHLTSTNLNTISNSAYDSALQRVQEDAGMANIRSAISALTDNHIQGGTEPKYGFQIAQRILERRNSNGDGTYTADGVTENRNTVVVFFTDGQPGRQTPLSESSTEDHINYANQSVAAALGVKNLNAKVFSIGVFAAGDNEPIVDYVGSQWRTYESSHNNVFKKVDHAIGADYWLRGNPSDGEQEYDDTVADYMRCMSSEYQSASNFLTRSTGQTGTYNDNRGAHTDFSYYTLASDEEALTAAFEAVAHSSLTPSTHSTLGAAAVLKDVIYTADFDVSGAVTSAKTVGIKMENDQVVEIAGSEEAFPITETVNADGKLSVTGFDYAENYCADSHPGKKLVITIDNLIPNAGGNLFSNNGDAAIYPDASSTEIAANVVSPTEDITKISKVIDFNGKMIIADNVKRFTEKVWTNGEFALSGSTLTYQLLPDQTMPSTNKGQINMVMDGVDRTLALDTGNIWTQYTAIPANNVYFDDVLNAGDAMAAGDGFGYNEAVTSDVSSGASVLNPDGDMVVYFTFKGTGIDIYCTTASADGAVQVSLVQGDHFDNANKVYFEDAEGKYVLNDEGKYVLAGADTPADATRYSTSSYAVINQSETTRYNVPTVTYTNLPYDVYTVYLKAMKGSQYKLDGVRVYDPLGAPDTHSQLVYKENNVDQESNARFYTLRDGLVNDNQEVSVEAAVTDPTTGVLFVDNVDSLDMKNIYELPVYPDAATAYKANSPKNEIYLDKDQAIAFTLSDAAKGDHYWIGLSAPDEGKNTGTVTVNGKEIEVTSAVDMYYPIEVGSSGAVTITNTGDNLISVTKLKVTSAYDAATVTDAANHEEPNTAEPFGLITEELLDMLIGTMAPVDQQVEETLPQALKDIIKQILSEFVRVLFDNVAKLFGN